MFLFLASHPISVMFTLSIKKDYPKILKPVGNHEVLPKYLGVGVNMSCGEDAVCLGLGSLTSQFPLSHSMAICV